MTPIPQHKAAEREAIARAVNAYLSDGGKIQKLGNGLAPIKNMTWTEESEARWQAKLNGDLPPKPERKRARTKPSKKDVADRLSAARAAKHQASRAALAPKVRQLAELGVIRSHIAKTIGVAAGTVDKIGQEHGIEIPLQPRRGTRQARNNAELREEWE